jgi:eukaryotic-like serine/threonine-protein kinase
VLDNTFSAPLIAPSPDGDYLLYIRDSSLFAQRFDAASATVSGEPTVLVDDVARVASPAYMPTVGVPPGGTSGGGMIAYQRGGTAAFAHLTWFDRTGKRLSDLTSSNTNRVQLSPDGKFAAFGGYDANQKYDIWVTDLARNVTSRLTFGTENNEYPVWTPDGKRVIYQKTGKGIFEKDATGAGEERAISTEPNRPFSVSSDGRFLLYQAPQQRFFLLPLSGDKKPVPVGSQNAQTTSGAISPDGKFLAFAANDSGQFEIYVQPMPPAVGRWQVSQGGGSSPLWRADGKELFFRGAGASHMAVDVKLTDTFSAGVPHELFSGAGTTGDYAVTPDGQRFLYRTQGSEGDAPIVVLQNWWLALKK